MSDQPQMLALPRWRRRVLLISILAAFALLLVRAGLIQLLPDEKVDREIAKRFERTDTLVALRGKILDRHMKRLAASEMLVTITASPKAMTEYKSLQQKVKRPDRIKKQDENLAKMLALLAIDDEKIIKKLEGKQSKYVVLSTKVAPALAKQVRALGVKGLDYRFVPYRHYSCHHDCGHLVGRKGKDDDNLQGYLGVERAFNDQLKGENGFHKVRRAQKFVFENIEAIARPRHGRDVVLSIDAKIQHFAYEALAKAVEEKAKAKAGAAIVLDAKTGEVLALATYPGFDPNVTGKTPKGGFNNAAVLNAYEPGSTMKSFAVAAGLEAGLFTPNTKIDTGNGALRIGKHVITDHEKLGVINVQQVLQKSSNIGTSKMAAKIGRERLWKTYKQLEFGQRTKVHFPGESAGHVNDAGDWGEVELATNSYGHGISVTLLQLARAYTVFANDGVLLPITLQKRNSLPLGKPVFSKLTVEQMREMLASVVTEEGTAPQARVEGYSVAGKTGTADKFDEATGRYGKDKYISSFVGMAPASKPKIIMAVMIDEPETAKRAHYGGVVAGPVFSEVVTKTLKHLQVPQDMPMQSNVVLEQKKVSAKNKAQGV